MPRDRGPCAEPEALEVIAELLRAGHSASFTAQGSSMYPALFTGDRVVIEPHPWRQAGGGAGPALRAGCDIILAKTGDGRTLLHRLVGERDGCLMMRGDNAPGTGEAITEVLGRLRGVRYTPASLARRARYALRRWARSRAPNLLKGWEM